MRTTRRSLGVCPRCDSPVPGSRLLIEYETADGIGLFAECPDCGDVVTPR